MQLVLEIKNLKDLEILLPLLKRLKISVKEESLKEIPNEEEKNGKRPLADFWGISPSLDGKVFEEYFRKTRDEWERPIS